MKFLAKFFIASILIAGFAVLMVRFWPVSLVEPKLLVRIPTGVSLRVAAQTLKEGGWARQLG